MELSQGINTHHQEAEQCGENEMSQLFGKSFETRDDLLQSTKSFYLEKGYATTIKKSKKDRFVRIGCDRGGVYRNRQNIPLELRKRKSSSRLINCPFEVVGRKRSDGTWILQLINDSHNHEASSDMAGHPTCRRFSGEEMQSVEEMASSRITPRQILSSLRQKNPNLRAVSRNVYNSISKIREEKLGGRTMVQALFEELDQGEFLYNIKHDENGCLTHIFFAHPTSIILSRSFPHVFVMDCTCRTNKYKMPLLDIIGVSCFNTSFYSCFTFMEKEREEDYVWALMMFREVLGPNCQPLVIVSDRELALMNAIRVVFPSATNLLCVWHIEKNILSNCKRYFEAQEGWDAFLSSWNGVIRSSSEIDFEKNWRLFEELYQERREVLTYIEKTWLPFKERFVDAWAEKFLHFGHRVSSRAERTHAKLKAYLQVSTGDFRQVKDKICLAITNEFQELKASLSSWRLRIPHNCNSAFFKEVVTKVSMHAMKQLYKQYEMVKHGTMDPSCTGHFTSTMGLPYAHKMMTTWKDGVLRISSIHSQWRIDSLSLTCTDGMMNEEDNFKEMLRELQDKFEKWPLMHKEKVCDTISELVTSTTLHSLREPSSGSKRIKGSGSTQRDPSRFEIVEKRRKWSGCKSSGHDIRTCPSKNKVSEQISDPIANSLDECGIGAIDLNMAADLDFDSSFN